jgi:hypothetical protein
MDLMKLANGAVKDTYRISQMPQTHHSPNVRFRKNRFDFCIKRTIRLRCADQRSPWSQVRTKVISCEDLEEALAEHAVKKTAKEAEKAATEAKELRKKQRAPQIRVHVAESRNFLRP